MPRARHCVLIPACIHRSEQLPPTCPRRAGGGAQVLLLTPARFHEVCARFADLRQILLTSAPAYLAFNALVSCKLLRGASHELVRTLALPLSVTLTL